MNKRLYKLMDWAFIEEVIYSECVHPQDLLGPHAKGQTTLLQAFFPGSESVVVKWKDRGEAGKPNETRMEVADDDGFYAQLLPTKDPGPYTYYVTYEERLEDGKTSRKKTVKFGDPYRHKNILKKEDIDRFTQGTCNDADLMLGAHPCTIDEEEGVLFAVYAPNAMRISVVGDFNSWDPRLHQMCKREDSGIFELFVPGAKTGDRYQYEIKFGNYEIRRFSDPYAVCVCPENKTVSVVGKAAAGKPAQAPKKAKAQDVTGLPISIYQADPYSYAGGETSAFARMSEELVPYVVKCGFSHICIGNILSSSGRHDKTLSYFAPDPALGTEEEFEKLVKTFRDKGVSVILDWIPSYFAPDQGGLSGFDGTSLYEHNDPRQGYAQDIGACLFNYSSNTVRNFLFSSGFALVRKFGIDGLRVFGTARMLYLDYGKSDWVPNIYGGNENLDAISFLQEFNTAIRKAYPGTLMIAEDSSLHQGITDPVGRNGLGFDLKWNEVFYDDYRAFISLDPLYRGRELHSLADSMTYAFVENFVLPFAGNEKTEKVGRFEDMLQGDDDARQSQKRLSLGYLFTHPGKKLIGLKPDGSDEAIITALNQLYKKEPALSMNESDPECFEWLSNMNTESSCVSFVRKTDDPEDMLVVIANFSGIEQNFQTGVPYEGKYKEIFTTDDKAFGGGSSVSKSIRKACDKRLDGRTQSIAVKIRPQSLIIMKFIPYTEEELEKVIEQRIRNYTPIKKTKK